MFIFLNFSTIRNKLKYRKDKIKLKIKDHRVNQAKPNQALILRNR